MAKLKQSTGREQARIMSRSKQVMQSQRDAQKTKNDGDRGSPEVLDEVKVIILKFRFYLKNDIYPRESAPLGVANCIR